MDKSFFESDLRIQHLRKLAECAGVINEPRWQKILYMINRFPEKTELYNRFEKILWAKSARQRTFPDPFFPYPKAEDICGDMELGIAANTGDKFGLKNDQIPGNVLITGEIGEGKTNLINVLVAELYKQGIG